MILGRRVFDRPIIELAIGAHTGVVYLPPVRPYADVRRWWAARSEQRSGSPTPTANEANR